jgi:argonaute-like protein implicated in RNA metabolism and viral defense
MRETNDEPKVTVGAVIPVSWKDELEKMAMAERKTVSELVRGFIDKGLHGQNVQTAQCYDYAARQVINIIAEILQLFYTMEGRADQG